MTPPANPAGEYVPEPTPSAARRAEFIAEIEQFPAKLRALVAGLTPTQIDTTYKNWTVRQIVHHLAESHMNGFIRWRLALTEDAPTIKPYDETKCSEMADSRTADVELSLQLLAGLHQRWAIFLRSLTEADFARTYIHPEYKKTFALGEVLGLYAWHGRHHSGQIAWLRTQHGWGAG